MHPPSIREALIGLAFDSRLSFLNQNCTMVVSKNLLSEQYIVRNSPSRNEGKLISGDDVLQNTFDPVSNDLRDNFKITLQHEIGLNLVIAEGLETLGTRAIAVALSSLSNAQ